MFGSKKRTGYGLPGSPDTTENGGGNAYDNDNANPARSGRWGNGLKKLLMGSVSRPVLCAAVLFGAYEGVKSNMELNNDYNGKVFITEEFNDSGATLIDLGVLTVKNAYLDVTGLGVYLVDNLTQGIAFLQGKEFRKAQSEFPFCVPVSHAPYFNTAAAGPETKKYNQRAINEAFSFARREQHNNNKIIIYLKDPREVEPGESFLTIVPLYSSLAKVKCGEDWEHEKKHYEEFRITKGREPELKR
jgi:hypothetical protein